jgi:hypothetical protein
MLPVVLALGNVVAGVGGNLIAEQIQRWHDQAHLPSEADSATWITAHVTTNADLRQALDTILEHLDEDAHIWVTLPPTISEEERESFANRMAEKSLDILLAEDLLILAGIEEP